jgi:hypothetical protein
MLDKGNLMVGKSPMGQGLFEGQPVDRREGVLCPLIPGFKIVPHVAAQGRPP